MSNPLFNLMCGNPMQIMEGKAFRYYLVLKESTY